MKTFKQRLDALGISQARFATNFCYNPGAVSLWCSGKRTPPPYALRTVELLEQGHINITKI